MALPLLAAQAIQNRPKVSVGKQTTTILLATGLGAVTFLGIRALVKKFKKISAKVRHWKRAILRTMPYGFRWLLRMTMPLDGVQMKKHSLGSWRKSLRKV